MRYFIKVIDVAIKNLYWILNHLHDEHTDGIAVFYWILSKRICWDFRSSKGPIWFYLTEFFHVCAYLHLVGTYGATHAPMLFKLWSCSWVEPKCWVFPSHSLFSSIGSAPDSYIVLGLFRVRLCLFPVFQEMYSCYPWSHV